MKMDVPVRAYASYAYAQHEDGCPRTRPVRVLKMDVPVRVPPEDGCPRTRPVRVVPVRVPKMDVPVRARTRTVRVRGLAVLRYVERHLLRAGLFVTAEQWRWGRRVSSHARHARRARTAG